MSSLSDKDRQIVGRLRADEVLENVEEHQLDMTAGTIVVACSDGDQFHDLMEHIWGMHTNCGCKPRTHVLTCHAGPPRIAKNSPVNRFDNNDLIILDDIAEASEAKGMDVAALAIHGPCARAAKFNLTMLTMIDLMMAAKERVLDIHERMKVACFVQIDHGHGRKRTYFISKHKWAAWCLSSRPTFEVELLQGNSESGPECADASFNK